MLKRVVSRMSDVENVGRCPRCRAFLTSEQVGTHKCHIPIRGTAEIYLDWIADGFIDENEDFVRMATSIKGILYSVILCKHNPPHSLESRLLTHVKSPEDRTEPVTSKHKYQYKRFAQLKITVVICIAIIRATCRAQTVCLSRTVPLLLLDNIRFRSVLAS